MTDGPLLRGVPAEPMRPLVARLRDAARWYPWLFRLLTEAADALDRHVTARNRGDER